MRWLRQKVRLVPLVDMNKQRLIEMRLVLANQKCAVLELSGRQVGLMAHADLSGLAITLK